MSSCSKSTWKQYSGHLKNWITFCGKKNISYTNADIHYVLEFFTELFESGVGYSSINTARSAISLLHNNIDNSSVGSHPLVVRLLKGVANNRPPSCKYNRIWDASEVLNFLDKQGENSKLDLKHLSYKLCSLLSLASGQRIQTLAAIRTNNIIFNSDNGVEIHVTDKLKTSRPGKSTLLSFAVLTQRPSLCVVRVLKEYIQRTSALREDDRLFISYKVPYKSVGTDTLSRWLRDVLVFSGIDTDYFKGYSYRHAAVSKAKKLGVSVDSIYQSAGWTQGSSMFAKFYNRPIISRNEFSNTLLLSNIN